MSGQDNISLYFLKQMLDFAEGWGLLEKPLIDG